MAIIPAATTEQLFSYGTLQQPEVQLATFGRLLDSRPDRLPGYRLALLAISDAQVVATSGKTHHPIASRGEPTDSVPGAVLAVSPEELRQADGYEVADYRRERVTLASGLQAWAYVDARDTAP
jgi:hypothetical protein